MENSWLTDYILYSERNGQAYARRACRPLESYMKRLQGLPITKEGMAAESKYLNIVPGGATCECPACQLRVPGSAGIFWAFKDDESRFPDEWLRRFR
ncbi:MAG: hypothetical protein ICV62_14500 [Cyanobacteria bacterium Co-bin13]|nr:hypothetical protein [Cyanobacteria bacterium Co-bin13]